MYTQCRDYDYFRGYGVSVFLVAICSDVNALRSSKIIVRGVSRVDRFKKQWEEVAFYRIFIYCIDDYRLTVPKRWKITTIKKIHFNVYDLWSWIKMTQLINSNVAISIRRVFYFKRIYINIRHWIKNESVLQ